MFQKNAKQILLSIIILFGVSLACSLPPKDPDPGILAAEIAKGRFNGTGNLTYGVCQDPTAEVIVGIGGSTKEIDGVEYYDHVNPATVSSLTDGAMPIAEPCEKISQVDKHDWPAKGIYYPKEGKIMFFSCSQTEGKAEGQAILVGEGFEGEYTCYHADGSVSYKVAFSAYTRVR